MKIRIVLIALLINVFAFSQSLNFAWLTDTHTGSPKAEEDLTNCVNDINNRTDVAFVVVSGDIAEKGRNKELEDAHKILENLKVPYYIIPGNHDTKWSESACTKFIELWKDDKFSFEYNGIRFIGINSGIIWRGGGGHVTPEHLNWLDSVITKIPKEQEVYFFIHHQLDRETDNWFKVTNILRKANIKAVFVGHGHSNKLYNFNGIPGAMGRSSLTGKGKSWGYTLAETKNDTIFLNEINNSGVPKLWGTISKTQKLEIPFVDSLQFKNYGVNIVAEIDLNTTISASMHTSEGNIFAATLNGSVYNWNSKGNQVWKYNTYNTIVSTPVASGGLLSVGTIEGDLITLNQSTGKVEQILGIGEPITSQLITVPFTFGTEKSFAIIAGTATGKLFSYELYSLNPVWTNSDAKMMIETKPLFVKDRIIYGSWDNYLYCVDTKSGMLNWKWSENLNFYYSPAACYPVSDGKNVYIATPDKYVSAVDLMLGKTVWRKNDFGAWESIGMGKDNKQLLIKSVSDKFQIAGTDGKKIKTIEVKYGLDTMPSEPIDIGGKVLFSSKNGYVYLIDEKGNFKPLLFLGTSRLHSVKQVSPNTFAVSNMDGKIIIFEL